VPQTHSSGKITAAFVRRASESPVLEPVNHGTAVASLNAVDEIDIRST
jgi:hypothetical protein